MFRDDGRREEFVRARYRRTVSAPRVNKADRVFEEHKAQMLELCEFFDQHGRLPAFGELKAADELGEKIGSLRRALGVLSRVIGPERFEMARQRCSQDLMVYLALARFDRLPKWKSLPIGLQIDISKLFGSYRSARSLADELLFSAGNQEAIDAACKAARIGKLMPTAMYVHVSALPLLPPLLRVYEGCGRVLTGTVPGTAVVKMHRFEPKISYLAYPNFDSEPHPELLSSVRVHLRNWDLKFREFRDSDNPPVLHRKDDLVGTDYPMYRDFFNLTRQEEAAGLYTNPSAIGTRVGWQRTLADRKVLLRGHQLVFRDE